MARKKSPKSKSSRKLTKYIKTSLFPIILGIILIIISLSGIVKKLSQPNFLGTPTSTVNQQQNQNLFPKKLNINRLSIELPITEAKIINGEWETSANSASHLITSSLPGNTGNIIIYGHNKKNLLGNLHSVKKGDQIELTTNEDKVYRYQVTETLTVSPTQIDVLTKQDGETLILYTCTSLLDTKRQVVKAKRI